MIEFLIGLMFGLGCGIVVGIRLLDWIVGKELDKEVKS
jgi:Mg/Co/Ni transporter MgtE